MLSSALRPSAVPGNTQALIYKSGKCEQAVTRWEGELATSARLAEAEAIAATERAGKVLDKALHGLRSSHVAVEGQLGLLGPQKTHAILSTIRDGVDGCEGLKHATTARIAATQGVGLAKDSLIDAQRESIAVLSERALTSEAELRAYILATRHLSDVLFSVRKYTMTVMKERALWQQANGLNPADLLPEEAAATLAGTDSFLGKCERLLTSLDKGEAPRLIGALSSSTAANNGRRSTLAGGGEEDRAATPGGTAPVTPQVDALGMTMNNKSFSNASPVMMAAVAQQRPPTSPSKLHQFLPAAAVNDGLNRSVLTRSPSMPALAGTGTMLAELNTNSSATTAGMSNTSFAAVLSGGARVNSGGHRPISPSSRNKNNINTAAAAADNNNDFVAVTNKLIGQIRESRRSPAPRGVSPQLGGGSGGLSPIRQGSASPSLNAIAAGRVSPQLYGSGGGGGYGVSSSVAAPITFIPPTMQLSCANPPNPNADTADSAANNFIKRAEVLRMRDVDAMNNRNATSSAEIDTIRCGERSWRMKGGDSARWVKPKEELTLLKLMLASAGNADVTSLLDALHSAHESNTRLKAKVTEVVGIKCKLLRDSLNAMRREVEGFTSLQLPSLVQALEGEAKGWVTAKAPALLEAAHREATEAAVKSAVEALQHKHMLQLRRFSSVSAGGSFAGGARRVSLAMGSTEPFTPSAHPLNVSGEDGGDGGGLLDVSGEGSAAETAFLLAAGHQGSEGSGVITTPAAAAGGGGGKDLRKVSGASSSSSPTRPRATGGGTIGAAREQFLDQQRIKQQHKLQQQGRLISQQQNQITQLTHQLNMAQQLMQQHRVLRAFPPAPSGVRKGATNAKGKKTGHSGLVGLDGDDDVPLLRVDGDDGNGNALLHPNHGSIAASSSGLLRVSSTLTSYSTAGSPAELMMTRVGMGEQSGARAAEGGDDGAEGGGNVTVAVGHGAAAIFVGADGSSEATAAHHIIPHLAGGTSSVAVVEGGAAFSASSSSLPLPQLAVAIEGLFRYNHYAAASGTAAGIARRGGDSAEYTTVPFASGSSSMSASGGQPSGSISSPTRRVHFDEEDGGAPSSSLMVGDDAKTKKSLITILEGDGSHALSPSDASQQHASSPLNNPNEVRLVINGAVYTVMRHDDDDCGEGEGVGGVQRPANGNGGALLVGGRREDAAGDGSSVGANSGGVTRPPDGDHYTDGKGTAAVVDVSTSSSPPYRAPPHTRPCGVTVTARRPWGRPYYTIIIGADGRYRLPKSPQQHSPPSASALAGVVGRALEADVPSRLGVVMPNSFTSSSVLARPPTQPPMPRPSRGGGGGDRRGDGDDERSLHVGADAVSRGGGDDGFGQSAIDRKIQAALSITDRVAASMLASSHGSGHGNGSSAGLSYNPNTDASALYLSPATVSANSAARNRSASGNRGGMGGIVAELTASSPRRAAAPPSAASVGPSSPRYGIDGASPAVRGPAASPSRHRPAATLVTSLLDSLPPSSPSIPSRSGTSSAPPLAVRVLEVLSTTTSKGTAASQQQPSFSPSPPRPRGRLQSLQQAPTITSPTEPIHYREVLEEAEAAAGPHRAQSHSARRQHHHHSAHHPLLVENALERAVTAESRRSRHHQERPKY